MSKMSEICCTLDFRYDSFVSKSVKNGYFRVFINKRVLAKRRVLVAESVGKNTENTENTENTRKTDKKHEKHLLLRIRLLRKGIKTRNFHDFQCF